MRDLSIVIPNWNGRALVAEFLPSALAAAKLYRQQQGANVELIIVDDASTDGSQQWLADNYGNEPLLRVIELKQNGGFVRAVNHGLAAASHPIILLLNNDVEVSHDAIAPLISHFDDERVFAVCCKAFRLRTDFLDGAGKLGFFKRGFWRVFFNYDILPEPPSTELPRHYSFFGSGAYTAYDATKLSALEGLQDLLAPIYWEDVEVCYRAWKRGWVVEYEPASEVFHLSSGTMGKSELRREMKVITERNRLLMTWINLHDHTWFMLHILWLSLKLALSAFSLNWAYWQSFLQAALRMRAVREARRKEKAASTRSDREIAAIFEELAKSADVYVLSNVKDYPEYVKLKQKLDRNPSVMGGKSRSAD